MNRYNEASVMRAKAEDDLSAAEYLMNCDKGLTSIICFHFQQYVEKMIKVKLIESDVKYPKTHDLVELLGNLPDKTILEKFSEKASLLTVFSVLMRYDGESPSVEMMEDSHIYALEIVSALNL